MKIKKGKIEDCMIIQPNVYEDDRGFFFESFNLKKYQNEANINFNFVQDNFSKSQKGVLRGLHFQKKNPQGKLVRVSKGKVFDVAVDIRKESANFGKWISVILSEENKKQFWIPPGYAHGFLVLSSYAHFEYKCTEYYDPDDEGCIIWNDKTLNIRWPMADPTISKKDAMGITFRDFAK